MTKFQLFLSAAFLFLSAVVQAQQCAQPRYIDDYTGAAARYTIGFNPPPDGTRSIVWPPDPALRGTVPCCLHSSGQSIAELEIELAFEGEIVGLLDGMNALVACMTEQQAQRWRADPRVQYVTGPDIIYVGLSPGAREAARNNPQLALTEGFSLTLPLVDYAGIPGQYQHARLEHVPGTQTWRLAGYRKVQPIRDITEVQLVLTGEVPAQAFLKVRGQLNNGCVELGEAGIRKDGDLFTVYLFYQYFGRTCMGTDDVRPFRKVIPLDVYGLPAGTYRWTLNGTFNGSFTLPTNNVLD